MTISPSARTVWRNYVTDGVPSSGNHPVKKSECRNWGTAVETAIDAYSSGAGSIAKSTRALLYADLAHVADVMAWVYADSTAAYNGIYRKSGASGTGSWTRILDLPYDVIIATDAGAGSANAIVATSSLPISESALILLNVFEANTASPVTVAFNGGSVLTIKTAAGNNVAVGGLVAGMALLGKITGSTFRMVSDQASAAIQAAAEAAQVAAEAAAASINQRIFTTLANAAATTIPVDVKRIKTQFRVPSYAVPATLIGGAHYRRASLTDLTGISDRLYFRSVDRFLPDGSTDASNGGYWLVDERQITPQMAGAIASGDIADMAENTAAIQALVAYAILSQTPIYIPPGVYCVNARPNPPQNTGLIHLTDSDSLTIIGVPGASILKNVANDPFALVSIQGGDNITIDGVEFDMNRQNVTATTGHCIVAYNVANPINRLRLRNIITRNAYAYGIGLQSAPIIDCALENISFLNNGNDALDIKPSLSSAHPKRAIFLKNLYADSVDQLGAGGKAAFDIRGHVIADGLYADGLTNTGGATVTGLRFNTEATAIDRDGSKKSRISNVIVTCADGTVQQTTLANSNIGIHVAERDVSLVNAHVDGFGNGVTVSGFGDNDSPPIGDGFSNITVKGARTGDGAGTGFTFGGSGGGYHRASAHVEDCDIGVVANSGTHQAEFTITNCTTAHTISAAVFAVSHFRFIFNGNTSDGAEGSRANFANSVAVYDGTTPSFNLENTKDDSSWSGPVGQLQFKSKDASGPGAGVRAAVRARMSGASGSETLLSLTASGASGIDQEIMQIWDKYVVINLAKVGNFADDAAAATGGVAVGAIYRTGSALKIRAS